LLVKRSFGRYPNYPGVMLVSIVDTALFYDGPSVDMAPPLGISPPAS